MTRAPRTDHTRQASRLERSVAVTVPAAATPIRSRSTLPPWTWWEPLIGTLFAPRGAVRGVRRRALGMGLALPAGASRCCSCSAVYHDALVDPKAIKEQMAGTAVNADWRARGAMAWEGE